MFRILTIVSFLFAFTACATDTVSETAEPFDCTSIDSSFRNVGDTCQSVCVVCEQSGGECFDSNKNHYGDTCVKSKSSKVTTCVPKSETCNNVDDDCDGLIDENDRFWYVDKDHDGWGDQNKPVVAGCVPTMVGPWLANNDEDCDDSDPGVSPVTFEVCGDNKDNNCSGVTDESCSK